LAFEVQLHLDRAGEGRIHPKGLNYLKRGVFELFVMKNVPIKYMKLGNLSARLSGELVGDDIIADYEPRA